MPLGYLSSTLDKFSVLHNFTIESQVQYHAPLAFSPHDVKFDNGIAHGITPEDLTVFVNSAEWTLCKSTDCLIRNVRSRPTASSVSNDHVIHFVLFVPSSHNNPLYIHNADGELFPSSLSRSDLTKPGTPSSANAFILPQWGGITILNKATPHLSASELDHVFTTFRRQLLSLLGVPPLPPHVEYDQEEPFTDWQLDALVRLRTRQNVDNSKDTLKSIVALVNQIENMPVGQDVKGDVQGALNALDKVQLLSSQSLQTHSPSIDRSLRKARPL